MKRKNITNSIGASQCDRCGPVRLGHRDPWYVVTIQVEDGHSIDGVFVTNDRQVIDRFATRVRPFMVYFSRYSSREQCEEFLHDLNHFQKIDLLTFRNV